MFPKHHGYVVGISKNQFL